MASSIDDDFSVFVLASDLGLDARSLLSPEAETQAADEVQNWHDCSQDLDDFADLDFLQFLRIAGCDKSGNRILGVVGKCFPAQVVSAERLKRYVLHKLSAEVRDDPFCIVYMHSDVQKEENCPGVSILRWVYEDLPEELKDRLKVVYFVHPGLQSRFTIATLGRFFLSKGLYWKIIYISRLQYLWEHVKKGDIEIPDFVKAHDDILEHRPLTDYFIEPDPFASNEVPNSFTMGRWQDRWESKEFMH